MDKVSVEEIAYNKLQSEFSKIFDFGEFENIEERDFRAILGTHAASIIGFLISDMAAENQPEFFEILRASAIKSASSQGRFSGLVQ